jgi:hypothetical protein
VDRRIIYILVAVALSLPLILKFSVAPAPMPSAQGVFNHIESLSSTSQVVFISLDFGPNSQAENLPQAEVVLEHLLRKRIPFVLFSQYALAEIFLESVPKTVTQRLIAEDPTQEYVYGKDWVNLGYRPNSLLIIQSIAQSQNLHDLFKKDARGNRVSDLALFTKLNTLKDISTLVQLTSLVGTLDNFLQFFQSEEYRPAFLHGCTSITIPQAFIYLDSSQIIGLFEGIAGAAWYSKLLSDKFQNRALDSALILNTSLGVAHLLIIVLIVVGNLFMFLSRYFRKDII